VVISYEEEQRWHAKQVNRGKDENGKTYGCDVLSTKGNKTRYIEVKANSMGRKPNSTVKVYHTAEKEIKTGNYWVYFVTNCSKPPKHRKIYRTKINMNMCKTRKLFEIPGTLLNKEKRKHQIGSNNGKQNASNNP